MWTIVRKELADQFSSTRFLILFCLISMVAVVTTHMVGAQLREALDQGGRGQFIFLMLFTSKGRVFPLVQFIALFGPLIGLVMGFDAINRERNQGTLSKLLSQPIYRDAVINGKFLAGVITITIIMLSLILLVSGIGLVTVGAVPGGEEVSRLAIYLVVSIAYVSFWLGLAILFSIFFRSVATSALAAVALWLVFLLLVPILADAASGAKASISASGTIEETVERMKLARRVELISPVELYTQATSTIMDPFLRTTGIVKPSKNADQRFVDQVLRERFKSPLALDQSLLMVMPYLTMILGLTLICFTVSYLVFMRQEIRSL